MVGGCNPFYKQSTLIYFVNNSDYPIYFSVPDLDHYYNKGEFFPDTTVISYWPYITYISLYEKEERTIASPVNTYEEWIPQGTEYYSLFVFPWYASALNEKHVESDEYYVRYDLTIDDIRSLCDSDGILNISYPPSPEMRHIKMWPPYEDAIKNVGTLRP